MNLKAKVPEICTFEPMAHHLEMWGDCRAYDGTVGFQQPLILPLYEGKTALDVITLLRDKGGRSGMDWVKEYWQAALGNKPDFQVTWEKALHDGVLAGSALPPKAVAVSKCRSRNMLLLVSTIVYSLVLCRVRMWCMS